ncbi:MAG: hypothetical protein ACLPN6_04810 [Streptosporangiaceae bacterium]
MRRLVMALTAGALLALGATGAQASVSGARPNATPECGSYCFELSSLILGPRMVENAVVPGDTGSGGRIGVPATLSLATNIAPDEDFTETSIGPASDFCGVRGGFPKYSYICIHYAADPVFEADWAPFGVESGLCLGLAPHPFAGERVTLRYCGVSVRTLWLSDTAHGTDAYGAWYTPWINGGERNFSHPLVLTIAPGGRRPANQLKVEREDLYNGVTPDTQEFTITTGPVP